MSNTSFALAEAEIFSLFLESIGYGAHAVTFIICVYTLLYSANGRRKAVSWPLLSIATALFAIDSLDTVLNFYRALEAFIFYQGPGGATAWYGQVLLWSNVTRETITLVQILIVDAALIYRCWVIYFRKWIVVALPILVWLGDAASIICTIYFTATEQNTTLWTSAETQTPFVDAYGSLTFVNNVMTTGLIIYRIWKVDRDVSHYFPDPDTGTRLSRANRVLFESALLYTVTYVIGAIVKLLGSNAYFTMSSVLMPIAGIQFDLIVIRVGHARAIEHLQSSMEPRSNLQFERESTTENTAMHESEGQPVELLPRTQDSRSKGGVDLTSTIV